MGFIKLELVNHTTKELTVFNYNDDDSFEHVIRLMVDDLAHLLKTNDPYDVWLNWTNVPYVDNSKWDLEIAIIEKDFCIHHVYTLFLRSGELMRNLQQVLFSIANDSEIDFTNNKNLVWEVLTW